MRSILRITARLPNIQLTLRQCQMISGTIIYAAKEIAFYGPGISAFLIGVGPAPPPGLRSGMRGRTLIQNIFRQPQPSVVQQYKMRLDQWQY